MSATEVYVTVVAFLFGLTVGSFLNVVIYRLPRHESVVRPASHCPACGHAIRLRHNIPVAGWLILRGRCYDCGAGISWRYPLVEMLTGCCFVLAVIVYGVAPRTLLVAAFLAVMIAVAFIDRDYFIIPDKIVLPAAAFGLMGSVLLDPGRWWQYLVAGAGASLFLFVLGLIWPGGMGMGDVKMALLLGVVLAGGVVVAMFVSFVVGGMASLILLTLRRTTRKSRIAFGPYLAFGGALAVLFGQTILDSYMKLYQH